MPAVWRDGIWSRCGSKNPESMEGRTPRSSVDADHLPLTTAHSTASAGSAHSASSPRHSEVTFSYDVMNRMVSQKDGLGNVVSFNYDDKGRFKESQASLGAASADSSTSHQELGASHSAATAVNTYDDLGRLVKSDYGAGQVVGYEYNLLGAVSRITTPAWKAAYQYDNRGRVTSLTLTGADGIASYDYGYTTSGQRAWMDLTVNGVKTRTTYEYDRLGRLAKVSQQKESRIQNSESRMNGGTNSRSSVNTADGSGSARVSRAPECVSPDGSAFSATAVSYSYDQFGRLSGKLHGDGTREENAYDAFGRPVSLRVISATGKLLTSVEYRWDAAGQLTERTRDGVVQKYEYDGAGQLTRVNVEYRSQNAGDRINHDGGAVKNSKPDTQNFAHRTVLPEENYSYDISGNLIEKQVGDRKTLYTYDLANRLTAMNEYDAAGKLLHTKEFAYDAMGRLVEESRITGGTNSGSSVDSENLPLPTANSTAPAVVKKTTRYEYGLFGKVSAVIKPDGRRVEYEYNPLGQLARKVAKQESRITGGTSSRLSVDSEQSTSHLAPSTQTDSIGFYWDGLALLQRGDESYLTEGHVSGGIPIQVSHEKAQGTQLTEESSSQNSESRMTGGTSSRSSVDSANSSHLRESAGSAPTSHPAPSTSHSATTSVVVSDFLGTTLGTVSGEQFAPVHLTAFGEILTADNTNHTEGSPSDIHSGFGIQDSEFSAAVFYTGKPYDEDLQSYHFLYRNYSPTKGRWTAADPSGFPDGPNQWLYVNNGVMNKVDPLGLVTVTGTPESGSTGSIFTMTVIQSAAQVGNSIQANMIVQWSVPEGYNGWVVQVVTHTFDVYNKSNDSAYHVNIFSYIEAWQVTDGNVQGTAQDLFQTPTYDDTTYGIVSISGKARFYQNSEISTDDPSTWGAQILAAGGLNSQSEIPTWWTGAGITHSLTMEW
ncbi:RHS repeat-associated core domain-containing protein [Kamptonema cortianum]|nr:RHS repeat-associated core domain-containing protein [Kamptonema cortianum]